MYKKTRAEGFGAEVKRRILVGTYVLSHGYYDAYYLKAQKVRRLIARRFRARVHAVRRDRRARPRRRPRSRSARRADDPVQMYLNDIYTIAGEPGRPAGDVDPLRLRRATGLPVGLQIQGNYFAEARMLERRASVPAGDRLAPARAPRHRA